MTPQEFRELLHSKIDERKPWKIGKEKTQKIHKDGETFEVPVGEKYSDAGFSDLPDENVKQMEEYHEDLAETVQAMIDAGENHGIATVAHGDTVSHGFDEVPGYVNLIAKAPGHIATVQSVDNSAITVGLIARQENYGKANVAHNGTIAHGLGEVPSTVNLTVVGPDDTKMKYQANVRSITDTEVTVNLVDASGASVGSAVDIYWLVKSSSYEVTSSVDVYWEAKAEHEIWDEQ